MSLKDDSKDVFLFVCLTKIGKIDKEMHKLRDGEGV